MGALRRATNQIALGSALLLAGLSLLVWSVVTSGGFGVAEVLLGILAAVGAATLHVGIRYRAESAASKEVAIVCPFCSQEELVLAGVSVHGCGECGQPILLAKKGEPWLEHPFVWGAGRMDAGPTMVDFVHIVDTSRMKKQLDLLSTCR